MTVVEIREDEEDEDQVTMVVEMRADEAGEAEVTDSEGI